MKCHREEGGGGDLTGYAVGGGADGAGVAAESLYV